ncbi:MAG: hypothetical protein IJY96_08040, partial [Oscillospiraceae bacterium]|nr:hypothetical protein [Oscillospiraceae bacterium]
GVVNIEGHTATGLLFEKLLEDLLDTDVVVRAFGVNGCIGESIGVSGGGFCGLVCRLVGRLVGGSGICGLVSGGGCGASLLPQAAKAKIIARARNRAMSFFMFKNLFPFHFFRFQTCYARRNNTAGFECFLPNSNVNGLTLAFCYLLPYYPMADS